MVIHKSALAMLWVTVYLGITSASLPEGYAFKTASSSANRVDPALTVWFKDHANIIISVDEPRSIYDKKLAKHDDLTRAFMRLRYANARIKDDKESYDQAVAVMTKALAGGPEISQAHPLMSYLVAEVGKSQLATPDVRNQANQLLDNFPGRSCPQRDRILKTLEEDATKNLDTDDLKLLLGKIASYRSARFRERALDTFVYTLPLDKQQVVKEQLFPMVQEFARLVDDNAWLKPSASSDKEQFKLAFREIAQAARTGKCNTARQDIIDLVAKVDGGRFEQVRSTANIVANCFKRKGDNARAQFWRDLEKPLEEKFNFLGRELAKRSQGAILWGGDQFDGAKRIFRDLIKEAQFHRQRDVEANALFTLARIEENEGRNEDAIRSYDNYVANFPDHERYEDAVMSLLLLNFVSSRYEQALKNVDDYLLAQSVLTLDEKSISANSFMLFWGGRLHLALGNKAMAIDMWRRLAADYYSTFYGAMGHYLMERVAGKAYELQPSRSPAFNADQIFASFSVEERPTLARIQMLLKLGMKNEVACELVELDASGPNFDRQLAKAMMQYSGGQWLDAIKTFDALPRSYRHALPVGFERLLYPIAYQPSVTAYANRLGVDPDFVFAIIRQESVFNPEARSSVGASGLMQLMPRTAAYEAKRLSQNYLSADKRRQIQAVASSASSLFNADTNVALGVHHVHRLMSKYKHPVLVLTSYNANPTATERWMNKLPTDDFLVFIERIPYNETRVYAKLVLRNYFYYKRWYQGSKKSMPHLDAVAKKVLVAAKIPNNPTRKPQ